MQKIMHPTRLRIHHAPGTREAYVDLDIRPVSGQRVEICVEAAERRSRWEATLTYTCLTLDQVDKLVDMLSAAAAQARRL